MIVFYRIIEWYISRFSKKKNCKSILILLLNLEREADTDIVENVVAENSGSIHNKTSKRTSSSGNYKITF